VTETWVVNFQGGPFHYAYRSIPLNNISAVTFLGVSENGDAYARSGGGSPNTYDVEINQGERQITWYFPTTTNQTRTFSVQYRLSDALGIYDGGDQFWYKFVESDRAYTINVAAVKVHLPSQF